MRKSGTPPMGPEVEGSERILILNPRSGAITDPEMVEAVTETTASRLGVRVMVTESGDDARAFARSARFSGVREILVAGGDGTVHGVTRGLWEAGLEGREDDSPFPILTILPLGTGNDLARCLGIPLDWREALDLAEHRSRIRHLDLLSVTLDDEPGAAVNAVIVGSGGRVGDVLDPEERKRWGPLSYLRSAAEVALNLEPVAVELAWDGGDPVQLDALNVVVANGRYAARGVPIAPKADPGDGRLELVVIRSARMTDLLAMAPAILREEDPDHQAYEHRQVRDVELHARTEDPLPVSLDGEHCTANHVRVSVLPGRLPVRVPPGQPQGDSTP